MSGGCGMQDKLDMRAGRGSCAALRAAQSELVGDPARSCAPTSGAPARLSCRDFCAAAVAALASGTSLALGVEAPRVALADGASASDGQAAPAMASVEASAAQVPSSLPSWVDEHTAQTLLSLAGDPTVDTILLNARALGEFGEQLAAKLLKLAADNQAARDFVARFRQSYPGVKAEGLTSDDLAQGGIPHLMQWDER